VAGAAYPLAVGQGPLVQRDRLAEPARRLAATALSMPRTAGMRAGRAVAFGWLERRRGLRARAFAGRAGSGRHRPRPWRQRRLPRGVESWRGHEAGSW